MSATFTYTGMCKFGFKIPRRLVIFYNAADNTKTRQWLDALNRINLYI